MVSYCEHVKIMVVPSISDLEDDNLLETLWYTRREYQQMKRQYTADLRTTNNTTPINGTSSERETTTSERGTSRATSTAVFGRGLLFVLLVYYGSCIAVMEDVVAFSSPPIVGTNYRHNRLSSSIFLATASTTETTMPLLLEPYLLVGIFGRLADKRYVVATTDEEEGGRGVTGTAASGYEFGVLEAGRPKWLCTYTRRHGHSQGGGATVTHVPHWCSRLFAASTMDENDENNDATNLLTKEKLVTILQELTFEMPLGAAPGLKQKAALPLQLSLSSSLSNDNDEEGGVVDSPTGLIVDCLWTLLGGENMTTRTNAERRGVVEEEGVTQDVVARHLKRMATDYGSNPDSMTYATFERAMQAQVQAQH